MPKLYIPVINQYIGTNIRLYRTIRGLTAHQLAEKLNICYYQLNQYELGNCPLKAERLLHIANALDIPLSYLVRNLQLHEDMSYKLPAKYSKATQQILQYISGLSDEQRHIALLNLKRLVEVYKTHSKPKLRL